MRKWRRFGSGGSSASLIAVCYVVVVGGLLCLLMVVTFRGDRANIFYIIGGGACLILLAIWLQRDTTGDSEYNAWVFWKRYKPPEDPLTDYACQKRRKAEKGEFGTQEPPQIAELHEEREHRNWVPRD